MGGMNHQPTSKASAALTVPASEALSEIGKCIFGANIHIERAIGAESVGLSYGAARAQLGLSVVQFDSALMQIDVFDGYVGQILAVLGTGQYEPFEPAASLDLDSFYYQLVDAGLVPDSAAARGAIETMRNGSYTGMFEAYVASAGQLADQITILRDLTADMRDGQAGLQGLFWHTVETNRQPWRQAFALVLTQFTTLLIAFQTGALISTETFLRGTEAPGLLTNVAAVTSAPQHAAITAG